jgi:hypothetical protein
VTFPSAQDAPTRRDAFADLLSLTLGASQTGDVELAESLTHLLVALTHGAREERAAATFRETVSEGNESGPSRNSASRPGELDAWDAALTLLDAVSGCP